MSKYWEIEVEMRVRKTLLFGGPKDAEAARTIVESVLQPGGEAMLATLQKMNADSPVHQPQPVEVIIDNDPKIISVREAAQ